MTDQAISITDSGLQKLYQYWLEKRGTVLAPKRTDMDPVDLVFILPSLYIIEVIGPPYRFRFRLAGTGLVKEYGGELTGKFADEIDLDGKSGELILAEYEKAVRDAHPIAAKWHYVKNDGRELQYEHLVLPLSSDGKNIDMLFGAAAMKGIGPIKGG